MTEKLFTGTLSLNTTNQHNVNQSQATLLVTSGLQWYIEYTVSNSWRYPIRRRVIFARALECTFFVWSSLASLKHNLSHLMRLWHFWFSLLILQIRMRSHPVMLDVRLSVGPFVYFHLLRVRTAKALVRLRGCAGMPEPSLVACMISTIISWAGSFSHIKPKR